MISLLDLTPSATMADYHIPVLRDPVLTLLQPTPGRLFVDGTLGGGGHAEAILEAGADVLGIDQDPDALAFATRRLSRFGMRFRPAAGNFADAAAIVPAFGVSLCAGVLLDLGVSSWQLDTPERGFSFQSDGPLDMRMSPTTIATAADLVNSLDEAELAQVIFELGEEPAARRIARAIVAARAIGPFETTLQLASCVASVVPRRGRVHPATRTFQALRLAVNRELEMLERGLDALSRILAPGGRMAVITFHSLEDRIVKRVFRHRSEPELDRPEWPAPRPNPDYIFRLLTPKPIVATGAEIEANPRSRSAKLRAVERIADHA